MGRFKNIEFEIHDPEVAGDLIAADKKAQALGVQLAKQAWDGKLRAVDCEPVSYMNGPYDPFSQLALDVVGKEDPMASIASSANKMTTAFVARNAYIPRAGFVLPAVEWLDSLQKLICNRRVLEIGAGLGIVGHLMRSRGLSWVSTDIQPYVDVITRCQEPELTDKQVSEKISRLRQKGRVIAQPADKALRTYKSAEVLFLSWCSLYADWDCLLLDDGRPAIVVSEPPGGCTGSEALWNLAGDDAIMQADEEFEWFNQAPRFCGINDFTWLLNWWE